MRKCLVFVSLTLASLSTILAHGQLNEQSDPDSPAQFRLSSATFTDGGTLPLSMALGSNNCAFVTGGGDQSPELSWTNAPQGTRSFVVTMFDVTTSFTHWGMYNISPHTTELPANSGVAGSTFGQQVFNDFFLGAEYDGPCPPNNLTPLLHEYVVTIFALDTDLHLTSFPPNFPADAETLYRAMMSHVLQKASIHGFFSSAN